MRETNMASISNEHFKTCPRCGSWLVNLEWDEPVNPGKVQDLWHCWQCQNKFITVEASDEKEPSVTEITKPFFTSLVVE
jgi:hypothetical protein